jgi:hypothetical protein
LYSVVSAGTLGEVFSVEVPFYFAGGAWILASLIASIIFIFPKRRNSSSGPDAASQQADADNGGLSETLLV